MKITLEINIPDEKVHHHTQAAALCEKLLDRVESSLSFSNLDHCSQSQISWEWKNITGSLNNEKNPA